MLKKQMLVGMLVLSLILALSPAAHAFSNLVAYGDSLSDNGNDAAMPFANGIQRFTDGPVWVELLAGATSANLYDTAFGGATTGWDNPAAGSPALGLQWQVNTYQPYFNSTLDMSDTLFTVWAGANDFFQGRTYDAAASNIGTSLNSLAAAGAQDILIPNLPDLGYTPAFYGDAGPVPSSLASFWTVGFNAALEMELAAFMSANPNVNLYYLDVYGIFDEYIQTDALGNIINAAEWQALFWDGVHPTSIGHELIAQEAYNELQPVPEPATMLLLGTGLAGLAALRRRKQV